MSSSLREGTMSEAADDWLRQHVHDLRNPKEDGRASHAKDALAKGKLTTKIHAMCIGKRYSVRVKKSL